MSNKEKTQAFKKRLYQFVLRLIKFVKNLPNNKTTKIISEQLLRSGTSILGNYIEAQASSSKKNYTNYLNHSLKSSDESKVWVTILRDLAYGDKNEADWLLKELDEFSRIFTKNILTLRSKKNI